VAALISVGLFSVLLAGIPHSLTSSAREIVGGDIIIKYIGLPPRPEGTVLTTVKGQVGTESVFISTAHNQTNTKSLRVELHVVNGKFPVLREVEFSSEEGRKRFLSEQNQLAVEPKLLIGLGLRIGDRCRIGTNEYIIADTIRSNSISNNFLTLADPKVYIREVIQQNGFLSHSRAAFHIIKLLLKDSKDVSINERAIRKLLPQARVDTAESLLKKFEMASGNLASIVGIIGWLLFVIIIIGSIVVSHSSSIIIRQEDEILHHLGIGHFRLIAVGLIDYCLQHFCVLIVSIVITFGLLDYLLPLFSAYLPSGIWGEVDSSSFLKPVLGSSLVIFSINVVCRIAAVYRCVRRKGLSIVTPNPSLIATGAILSIVTYSICNTYNVLAAMKVTGSIIIIILGSVMIIGLLAAFSGFVIMGRGQFSSSYACIMLKKRGLLRVLLLALALVPIISGYALYYIRDIVFDRLRDPIAGEGKILLVSALTQADIPTLGTIINNDKTLVHKATLLGIHTGRLGCKEYEVDSPAIRRQSTLRIAVPVAAWREHLYSARRSETVVSVREKINGVRVKAGDRLTFSISGVAVESIVSDVRAGLGIPLLDRFDIIVQSDDLEIPAKDFIVIISSLSQDYLQRLEETINVRISHAATINIAKEFSGIEFLLEVASKILWISLALFIVGSISVGVGMELIIESQRIHEMQTLFMLGASRKLIKDAFRVEDAIVLGSSSIAVGVIVPFMVLLVGPKFVALDIAMYKLLKIGVVSGGSALIFQVLSKKFIKLQKS
jgi:hypothetical protein